MVSNIHGDAGLAAMQALAEAQPDRRHAGLGRHPDAAGAHGGPRGRRPAAATHVVGGGGKGADCHRFTGRDPARFGAGHRRPRGRRRRGRAARHAAARQPAAPRRAAATGAGGHPAQHHRLSLGRRGAAGRRGRQCRGGRTRPVECGRRPARGAARRSWHRRRQSRRRVSRHAVAARLRAGSVGGDPPRPGGSGRAARAGGATTQAGLAGGGRGPGRSTTMPTPTASFPNGGTAPTGQRRHRTSATNWRSSGRPSRGFRKAPGRLSAGRRCGRRTGASRCGRMRRCAPPTGPRLLFHLGANGQDSRRHANPHLRARLPSEDCQRGKMGQA